MAESPKKQRKSNFSQEEIETIVRAVRENYDTLYGTYAKKAVNKSARHKVWSEVTKEVNQVSYEKRTLQEVKNKWKKCQHLYRMDDAFNDNSIPDSQNVWEPLTELDDDEDSMPLEQRLRAAPPDQSEPAEQVLQSQPLSPTKLKVTRQAKPPQLSPLSPSLSTQTEEICLKWNSHHSNMQNTFPNLLLREQYVDATLVAEGQTLKCHKIILSSCSPYFEEVLAGISPYQHPVLFMKDVSFWALKALCDFMYAGEVNILQTKLEDLLAVAENLKIKGLACHTQMNNSDVKMEVQRVIKEEMQDEGKSHERELRRKDDRESNRRADKDAKKELRKKEEREIKKKEEKDLRFAELRTLRRREESKRKEEKDAKDKRRSLLSSEMPVLKNARSTKVAAQSEMPNLKSARPLKTYTKRAERRAMEREKLDKSNQSKEFLSPLLDLLEPVYEEIENDVKPIKSLLTKDTKNVHVRQRRMKKRKLIEEKEESPPPVFMRRGTRSRPNRKIPKLFHPPDEQSTIVREPHTDPLMNLQCIKSEPLYDDSIDIEDNLVGFSESSMSIDHLIGGYDQSPFTGLSPPASNRCLDNELQPIILDVQSIANKPDDSSISGLRDSKLSDPLEDPLILNNCNVEDADLGFRISEVVTEKDENLGFQITSVVSEQDSNAHFVDIEEAKGNSSHLENDDSPVTPTFYMDVTRQSNDFDMQPTILIERSVLENSGALQTNSAIEEKPIEENIDSAVNPDEASPDNNLESADKILSVAIEENDVNLEPNISNEPPEVNCISNNTNINEANVDDIEETNSNVVCTNVNNIPDNEEHSSNAIEGEIVPGTNAVQEDTADVLRDVTDITANTPGENSNDSPENRAEEASSSDQPGFHIAQVVSDQIAEIGSNRSSDEYQNDSESCQKNYNELESIVNDLSMIVNDSCSGLDDANLTTDSLEHLLNK
ncbi:unnamed protein product [Phyllotreta striolata]|uniref:Regulatory protein zeste n=1 Tax=Phyllotreta striolata TaxID=444603 RepID=A0A9N9TU55_PHYSR|nr:unnamed protein product [Phyllotreta striolata]